MQLRSWSEVEDWLRREILRCYPDSEFAKDERLRMANEMGDR